MINAVGSGFSSRKQKDLSAVYKTEKFAFSGRYSSIIYIQIPY